MPSELYVLFSLLFFSLRISELSEVDEKVVMKWYYEVQSLVFLSKVYLHSVTLPNWTVVYNYFLFSRGSQELIEIEWASYNKGFVSCDKKGGFLIGDIGYHLTGESLRI